MARSITADILTKLQSNEITYFFLIQFVIDGTTYYYTNCDVPIYYNSNMYQSRTFSFDGLVYSNNNIVDTLNITIDNRDNVMTLLFADNVINEQTFELYLIVYDDNDEIIAADRIFNGIMSGGFELDEEEIVLTVTSIITKWDHIASNKYSSLCRWRKLGGIGCEYSGDEVTCDRSYSRCLQLENTDRFGGFRWIESIEDKDIWWGKKPK